MKEVLCGSGAVFERVVELQRTFYEYRYAKNDLDRYVGGRYAVEKGFCILFDREMDYFRSRSTSPEFPGMF